MSCMSSVEKSNTGEEYRWWPNRLCQWAILAQGIVDICQAQGTEGICKACGEFKSQGLLGLGQVFIRKVYVMQCHACLVLGSLTLVMNTDGGQIHMHR